MNNTAQRNGIENDDSQKQKTIDLENASPGEHKEIKAKKKRKKEKRERDKSIVKPDEIQKLSNRTDTNFVDKFEENQSKK